MKKYFVLLVACLLAALPLTGALALTENTTGLLTNEPITLRGFVYEQTPFNANHDEMPFWDLLSEETGIKFELERVSNQAWVEQLNLKLVSGDLPDFIGGNYNAITDDLIARYGGKAFLDISGLLEENAPNLMKLFELDPQMEKVMRSLDGGIYTFPSYWTEVEQKIGGITFINTKWLDAVGLSMPETLDDLYNVLVAFKTQDPNGNGLADEIPISAMKSGERDGLEMLIMKVFGGPFGFPLYANHLAIENGEVYLPPATENYKEMIKFLAKLYAEGLIDPEIFTIDRPTFVAKMNRPADDQIVGIGTGGIQEQNFVGAENLDEFEPLLPVVGPNGDRSITDENNSYMRNVVAITTANKHPELTVQLFDRLYAPLWSLQVFEGPIGHAIELSEDGVRYQYMTPADGLSIDQMRFQNSPVSFVYFLDSARMDALFVPDPIMMENTWSNCNQLIPYVTEEPNPPVWPMSMDDSQEVAQMRVELINFIRQSRANWVAGKSDIDAEWDTYLATLEALGASRYVELHQQAYDVFNAQ